MGFTWQRLVRVCACAAIFAIGLLGTLLVSSESAWTQTPSTTDPPVTTEPPPIETVTLPTVTGPDPPPPPPPPKDDPPPPGSGGSTSGPRADSSEPSATTGAKKATKPKANKPKKKKKKKKRVRAEQAFVTPLHAPRDPPGAGGSVGGSAFTTTSSSNGLAVPIAVLMLATIAVGAAFLLMLAAMPVRSLAGVSVRLAQRRGEVGLVTICFLLASITGFVLALMSG